MLFLKLFIKYVFVNYEIVNFEYYCYVDYSNKISNSI